MSNDKENNSLIIYNLAVYYFEEVFIKSINILNDREYKELEGYLINLKDYENIKKLIDYKNNKPQISPHYLGKKIEIKEKDKKFQIKEIEFKTSKYFINMLFNGNKYILISKQLWEILCDEKQKKSSPVKYEINNSSIILYLNTLV